MQSFKQNAIYTRTSFPTNAPQLSLAHLVLVMNNHNADL